MVCYTYLYAVEAVYGVAAWLGEKVWTPSGKRVENLWKGARGGMGRWKRSLSLGESGGGDLNDCLGVGAEPGVGGKLLLHAADAVHDGSVVAVVE